MQKGSLWAELILMDVRRAMMLVLLMDVRKALMLVLSIQKETRKV